MRLLYFDASALVKAHVAEPGSECVARIFEAADHLFTCRIAFAREVVRIPITLISSDQRQLTAARHESLPVFDPERDDPATLG